MSELRKVPAFLSLFFSVIPSGVEESLTFSDFQSKAMARDVSASLDMTKKKEKMRERCSWKRRELMLVVSRVGTPDHPTSRRPFAVT